MMKDRILKALKMIVVFAMNTLFLTYVVRTIMTYWTIPELDSSFESPMVNSGFFSIVFMLFCYGCFVGICLLTKSQSKVNFLIVCVTTVVYIGVVNNSQDLQLKAMNSRYEKILKTGNYAKSDHAILLKKAVDDGDTKKFVTLLTNRKDVYEAAVNDQIAVLEIIEQITPNLKPKARIFLNDDYLTMTEYASLKEDILKEIQNINLTGDQISMIRSFK